MREFYYHTPTEVFFGKGKEKEVGKIISSFGVKKVMLQYGKNSIKKSGLYDTVISALKASDIEVVEMGGVEPNPKLTFVREAVKIAKAEKVEMILAVGGGSVIDSCKYTALGAVTDVDVWDIAMGKVKPENALPVGCILTISAAGSEMSNSAVITNLELNMKKGLSSELNRCKFAIMNPELTATLSEYQTACGIVDIMSHTMERFFSIVEPTELTDGIATSILRSVVKAGKVLMKNPSDYEARATVMWASSLSHNGLTGCGRENYLAVHQLEHALSGEYDFVAHGAGLAVLFPAWAKYVYKYNPSRFAEFGREVFGASGENDEEVALKGILEMENFFKLLKMPSTLSQLSVPESSIERLADLCTYGKTRTIKSYIPLGFKEICDIFTLCK